MDYNTDFLRSFEMEFYDMERRMNSMRRAMFRCPLFTNNSNMLDDNLQNSQFDDTVDVSNEGDKTDVKNVVNVNESKVLSRTGYVSVVNENENVLELQTELPGLTKDDVKVDINGNMVSWSGHRNQTDKTENGVKSYTFDFSNQYALPFQPKNVRAKMENGVLNLSFDKPENVENKFNVNVD